MLKQMCLRALKGLCARISWLQPWRVSNMDLQLFKRKPLRPIPLPSSTNTANIPFFVEPGVSSQIFPFYFLVVAALSLLIVLTFMPDYLSMKGRVILDRDADKEMKA